MNISAYSSGNQTKNLSWLMKSPWATQTTKQQICASDNSSDIFLHQLWTKKKKKKALKIPLNEAQFSKLSYFIMEEDRICGCQAGDINSITVKKITFLGWNDVNKTQSQ